MLRLSVLRCLLLCWSQHRAVAGKQGFSNERVSMKKLGLVAAEALRDGEQVIYITN